MTSFTEPRSAATVLSFCLTLSSRLAFLASSSVTPRERLPVSPPFQMCNCSDDGTVVAIAKSGVWVVDRRRSSTFCLAEWSICNEVALSPDGRWVAGRKWGSAEIHIWEIPSQKEVKIFTLYYPHFRFSPDGRWFISGTETDLCSWEVGTWRQAYSCPHDGYGSQGRLALSRDGRWAALEESGGAVKLLSLPTLDQVVTLESVPGFPVSLSPDGSRLLVQTGKGKLGLWNLRRINQELTDMRLGWEDKTARIPETSRASLGSVPASAPPEREAMTNVSSSLHR